MNKYTKLAGNYEEPTEKVLEANSYLPRGPVHTYQLEESIRHLRCHVSFFSFILFRKEILVCKQCRP